MRYPAERSMNGNMACQTHTHRHSVLLWTLISNFTYRLMLMRKSKSERKKDLSIEWNLSRGWLIYLFVLSFKPFVFLNGAVSKTTNFYKSFPDFFRTLCIWLASFGWRVQFRFRLDVTHNTNLLFIDVVCPIIEINDVSRWQIKRFIYVLRYFFLDFNFIIPF